MHPAVLLVVGVLFSPSGAAHHRAGAGASRWDQDDADADASSRARHHLRHHGQDAPAPTPAAAGRSDLDDLINRLETLNGVDSARAGGEDGYWRGHKAEDREGQLAQEELRKIVLEYERGDVLPDPGSRAAAAPAPAPTAAAPRRMQATHAALAARAAGHKGKHHAVEEDDLDEDDLDSSSDEDDKDDDEEDDDFDEDAESEEADKSVGAPGPRGNPALAEMLDVDAAQTLSDAPPEYQSFSDHKWNAYSTPERLAHTRRHGASPQAQTAARNAKLAKDHMARMMGSDGVCRVPKPMVINVKLQYPDPSKEYVPHCTILHRCTDSTGCCRSSEETCKPKASATHKVELAFYTTRVGYNSPIVEMLTFYNETECECVRTEDRFYRGSSLGAHGASHGGLGGGRGSSLASDSYYSSRKQRQARTQLDMPPSYIQLAPYTKPGCRCPSTYSPRDMPQPRGCACDCFDRQTDCLRFKRGKEYFSMEDRFCIQTGACKVPECEFGTYMKLSGRCPKKNEKFMRYTHRRP